MQAVTAAGGGAKKRTPWRTRRRSWRRSRRSVRSRCGADTLMGIELALWTEYR